MQEIRVHYETPPGLTGSVTVMLADTYPSAADFVEESELDYPDRMAIDIEEVE